LQKGNVPKSLGRVFATLRGVAWPRKLIICNPNEDI
jgi:hypothetical protein